MSYNNNVYGLQKTQETEVRSNGAIAAGAASSAAKGASMGATFGPWGAVVGGAIGAGVGIAGGISGRNKEIAQQRQQKAINDFVSNLEGRSLRTQEMVGQQARHGMKKNEGRYIVAEIEGDGTNRYEEGIGEIHVDKNFNIKTLAKGMPTHEQGGVKVTMEEGDTVFPTQTSKEKYNKILSDIRRYKTYGDERALKRLKKERDKLPTDEDYDKAAFPDGVQNVGNKTADVAKKYGFDPEALQRLASSNLTQKQLRTELEELNYDPDEYAKFLDETVGEGENITGNHVGSMKTVGPLTTKATTQLEGMFSTPSPTDTTGEFGEFDSTRPGPLEDQKGGFKNSGKDPSEVLIRKGNVLEDVPTEEFSPASQQTAQASGRLNINMGDSLTETESEAEEQKSQTDANSNFWEKLGQNNPLKYASALTNAAIGMQPAELVNRRHVAGNFYDYEDMSNRARQENIENRNFMARALGNRVDRSGSLGTMAQVQSRYLGQSEAINENEARRRYAVDQQNTALSNQLNQINTQIAREDDDKDAANRAARQRFLSTAAAETAELAQYDEQKRYMMSKDRKAEQRDQDIIDRGYISSTKYQIDPTTKEVVYKEPKKTTTKLTIDPSTGDVEKHRKGVKNKQLKPGSYRMLPDGTIIID